MSNFNIVFPLNYQVKISLHFYQIYSDITLKFGLWITKKLKQKLLKIALVQFPIIMSYSNKL